MFRIRLVCTNVQLRKVYQFAYNQTGILFFIFFLCRLLVVIWDNWDNYCSVKIGKSALKKEIKIKYERKKDKKEMFKMIELDIPLLDTTEIKTGKGAKGGGKKYTKYINAIEENKIDQWAKEQIASSKSGVIRLKLEKLLNVTGMKLRTNKGDDGLSETGGFWGFKYAFYLKGLWLSQGTTISNESYVAIRLCTEKDKLPDSLAKKLRESEEINIKEVVKEEDGEREKGVE